jgi:hypothetical protein
VGGLPKQLTLASKQASKPCAFVCCAEEEEEEEEQQQQHL